MNNICPHYFFGRGTSNLQLLDTICNQQKHQNHQTFSSIKTKRQDLNKKMANRILVMVSNNSLSRKSSTDQRRALSLLASNKIPYEVLDGMDPARKERRNELFGISGIRGRYPQFFTLDENDNATFLGDWETVEEINDSSSLPNNILEANPSIVTWCTVFSGVKPYK